MCLPGLLREAAGGMRERVWCELGERYGLLPDDPTTWRVERPSGLKALRRSGAFDALCRAPLTDLYDELLGEGAWLEPEHPGVPLITFPRRAPWDVPSAGWHLDLPPTGKARPLPVVRLLALVERVEAQAGGTLVLAGSHRLLERCVAAADRRRRHSASMRRVLGKADPWLAGLFSSDDTADRVQRFMVDGTVVDGVPLRVVELTGEPGDVFLMHPWLFHAGAPNCGRLPRMMVTHTVQRRSAP